MFEEWQIEFVRADAKWHSFTIEDVEYASTHLKRIEQYATHGGVSVKFTGPCPRLALVSGIEVMMRILPKSREVLIYHCNVEQSNFWDRSE